MNGAQRALYKAKLAQGADLIGFYFSALSIALRAGLLVILISLTEFEGSKNVPLSFVTNM